MSTEGREHLERLVDSLRLLAADFREQVGILPHFVQVTDEIALTFDECAELAPQLVNEGLLTERAAASVRRIDAVLQERSAKGHAAFWALEALERHPTWAELRSLAADTLRLMGRAKAPPRLDWVTYVRGNGDDPPETREGDGSI